MSYVQNKYEIYNSPKSENALIIYCSNTVGKLAKLKVHKIFLQLFSSAKNNAVFLLKQMILSIRALSIGKKKVIKL